MSRSNRPSPSESATLFSVGTVKRGNDGTFWQVSQDKNGTQRWKRIQGQQIPKTNPKEENLKENLEQETPEEEKEEEEDSSEEEQDDLEETPNQFSMLNKDQQRAFFEALFNDFQRKQKNKKKESFYY